MENSQEKSDHCLAHSFSSPLGSRLFFILQFHLLLKGHSTFMLTKHDKVYLLQDEQMGFVCLNRGEGLSGDGFEKET